MAGKETYLVIAMSRWGSGDTLDEAKSNYKKQGGKLNVTYGVYLFDAETTFVGVDQMGYMHYEGNSPTLTTRQGKARETR